MEKQPKRELDILYTPSEVQAGVQRVWAELMFQFHRADKSTAMSLAIDLPITFVGVLNGAFLFMNDLMRYVPRPDHMLGWVVCQSYRNKKKGQTHFQVSPIGLNEEMVAGRHVVLVDDICDTGDTLKHCKDYILGMRPRAASVTTVVLLNRHFQEPKLCQPDIAAFQLMSLDFVVGYGLDWQGRYRTLPYIGKRRET